MFVCRVYRAHCIIYDVLALPFDRPLVLLAAWWHVETCRCYAAALTIRSQRCLAICAPPNMSQAGGALDPTEQVTTLDSNLTSWHTILHLDWSRFVHGSVQDWLTDGCKPSNHNRATATADKDQAFATSPVPDHTASGPSVKRTQPCRCARPRTDRAHPTA
jgi:hypothetical protein